MLASVCSTRAHDVSMLFSQQVSWPASQLPKKLFPFNYCLNIFFSYPFILPLLHLFIPHSLFFFPLVAVSCLLLSPFVSTCPSSLPHPPHSYPSRSGLCCFTLSWASANPSCALSAQASTHRTTNIKRKKAEIHKYIYVYKYIYIKKTTVPYHRT